MNIHEYLNQLRRERRITLRTFASQANVDAANYSKMERGLMPIPTDLGKLEPFRRALGLEESSPQWTEFVRLASLSRGLLPPRIRNNEALMEKLPAFFRSLEEDNLSPEKLDRIIAIVREE